MDININGSQILLEAYVSLETTKGDNLIGYGSDPIHFNSPLGKPLLVICKHTTSTRTYVGLVYSKS